MAAPPSSEASRVRASALLGVGVAAGFVSGLLGVGGGVIAVPMLVLLVGLAQHRAHAASAASIAPVAAVGAATFAAAGEIDYPFALALAVGAIAGAPLGVRLAMRVPARALRAVFGLASVVIGVRLLV